MKVGTDGLLLGAWTHIPKNTQSILDVGAGTGLIALQMAQRSHAGLIDAVEIDPDAYEECVGNFENSPWGDRLFCYHASFRALADEMDEPYDLIVSNPPFHQAGTKPEDPGRKKARSADSLEPEDLFSGSARLLSDEGLLSIIYPYQEEARLLTEAEGHGLWPGRICRVKGKQNGPVVRSLITFGKQPRPVAEEALTIRTTDGKFSREYADLVAEFYLKM
jgi:tRNA1Val (adenine37-N6)-methyltransferase